MKRTDDYAIKKNMRIRETAQKKKKRNIAKEENEKLWRRKVKIHNYLVDFCIFNINKLSLINNIL